MRRPTDSFRESGILFGGEASSTFPIKMENKTFRPSRPPFSSVKLTNCSTAGAYLVMAKSSVCCGQQGESCAKEGLAFRAG